MNLPLDQSRCCQGDATSHAECWDESYSFEDAHRVCGHQQLKPLKLDMSHWRLLRYEIFMILIAKGEIKFQRFNESTESSRSSGMCQAIYH